MQMHPKLVQEGRDGDVAGFLEGRELQLVIGEHVGRFFHRQLARAQQACQQDLSQTVGVGGGEEQQGMALERAEDTDVYGQDHRLGPAGHGQDLGRGAALQLRGLDFDDLAAHRAERFAGALHRPPEGSRDGVLTGFGEGERHVGRFLGGMVPAVATSVIHAAAATGRTASILSGHRSEGAPT